MENTNQKPETYKLQIPAELVSLYSMTDKERFPAGQLAEGLEREGTLFWADFTVAEAYGVDAVRSTFKNCLYQSRPYKEITELVIVLNHKTWQFYEKMTKEEKGGRDLAKIARYHKLYKVYEAYYYEVNSYAHETLTGDEARFFFAVTD